MSHALELISALPLGTRVVIRYQIDGGTTDALGDLTGRDSLHCTVATRSGDVVVKYDDVHLAKVVPPPPPRRERRTQA
ncbi:hypothetical protein AOC05_11860 [Arthrobacter alpinus]|uniref:Histone acetyltransferase Rv0428c-like SH3 domain-containing protein n=1 Tax=Arthrobacter alpinus TaxID=656366 RepID=A0A0M4QQQ7_9MICC|nr:MULTISPECIES: hypothetical protein [Arthrobacter]ALE92828.1 hypothetical protein AOC05_11860 [Arthrobacter alpinus]